MKKIYTFYILLIITTFICKAQVFTGNIQLENQTDVDNFAANQYTSITGNLIIGAGGTEHFNCINNFTVNDLSNLNTITSVGGDLKIYRNNILTTLNGLNNITTVGGKLDLFFQPALIDLNALSSITSVNDLELFNLDLITNLNGLSNLTTIGNNCYINNNQNLLNLNSLSSLTSIGGLLKIFNNDSLTNLGLSQLTSVINISIDGNAMLTDLQGLENINPTNRNIFIVNNSNLNSVVGLNFHNSIGSIDISNNPNLNDISNLNSLTSINGTFNIQDNDLLVDLSGFSNVTTITGGIGIGNNQNLTSLNGLNQLSTIGWSIIIGNNPQLNNIDALSNLSYIPRALTISNNSSLTNIDGLINVTAINTGFTPPSTIGLNLTQNNALTNLDGLINLNVLGGNTRIRDNNSLLDFCGIQTYVTNYSNVFEVTGNGYNPTQQDVINNNCSTLSIESFQNNQVQIYPNPTTDFINIKTNDPITKVELYSLQGQKVNASFSNNTVDVQDIASGVYFLKIKTTKGELVKKIIKE